MSTLAHDILGLRSKKDAEHVRDIIEAEHATELLISGGTFGRLLNRTILPARGRFRGKIGLVLGTLLLPSFVHELKAYGLGESRALRLVPMLELPPFVGDQERSYGPQATFSMLLVAYMRDNAKELVKHGPGRFVHVVGHGVGVFLGLPAAVVGAAVF